METDTFASATLDIQEPIVRISTPAIAILVSTEPHVKAIAILTYVYVPPATQEPIVITSMPVITTHVSMEPPALTLATAISVHVLNSTVESTVKHIGIHAPVLHA